LITYSINYLILIFIHNHPFLVLIIKAFTSTIVQHVQLLVLAMDRQQLDFLWELGLNMPLLDHLWL